MTNKITITITILASEEPNPQNLVDYIKEQLADLAYDQGWSSLNVETPITESK